MATKPNKIYSVEYLDRTDGEWKVGTFDDYTIRDTGSLWVYKNGVNTLFYKNEWRNILCHSQTDEDRYQKNIKEPATLSPEGQQEYAQWEAQINPTPPAPWTEEEELQALIELAIHPELLISVAVKSRQRIEQLEFRVSELERMIHDCVSRDTFLRGDL